MKAPIILHIPHSSIHIPSHEGYVVTQEQLQSELIKLTDWYTDDLFDVGGCERMVVPFSRIFCDVERFENDQEEPMSHFGMGAIYEKMDSGEQLRILSASQREKILEGYYRKHHEDFTRLVDAQLAAFGRCLIIDCHSFPNTPLKASFDKISHRPDYNIGTDVFHTPPKWVEISERHFKDLGHSVLIDKPYSGSIVPMKHYRKDKRVQSIMLEINRKLYLEGESANKSENYKQVKSAVAGWVEALQKELVES
jgi:N-formylglutamate amidohydrolase